MRPGSIERRVAEPILPFHLVRQGTVAACLVAGLLSSMVMYGLLSYVPRFVQAVIGSSATSAGAALMPLLLGDVLASAVNGQWISRTGRIAPECAARCARPDSWDRTLVANDDRTSSFARRSTRSWPVSIRPDESGLTMSVRTPCRAPRSRRHGADAVERALSAPCSGVDHGRDRQPEPPGRAGRAS